MTDQRSAKKAKRTEKQAAALKANLKKRKEQAKAKAVPEAKSAQ